LNVVGFKGERARKVRNFTVDSSKKRRRHYFIANRGKGGGRVHPGGYVLRRRGKGTGGQRLGKRETSSVFGGRFTKHASSIGNGLPTAAASGDTDW